MEAASIKDVSFVPQQCDKRLHSSEKQLLTTLSSNSDKSSEVKRKKITAKDQNR